MIRILHIVHSLTRGGGLSNFVMNYYRNIDRAEIQFDFVYFKESEKDFKDEIVSLGGKYYKWNEPRLDRKYIREADDFFKNHSGEYKAIHCHALFAVAAYGRIAKKNGVPFVIAHAHSFSYGTDGIFRMFRNWIFVLCCRYQSDLKLACSDKAAQFMFGAKQFREGKIRIISNAIDCRKYLFNETARKQVRKEFKIPEDWFVIGHIGGFAAQKNHEFLVSFFYKFQQIHPNSCLFLIGGEGIASGTTMAKIKKIVSMLSLEEKVIFTGLRTDVYRLLSCMDIFVFPSLVEGFGIALVEAQSNGLKCLASSNVPAFAKCTDNVSYLDLDDEESWLNSIDVQEYDRTICIKDFHRFDIDYQSDNLQKLYLSL